ncbi:MAG: hypothetical protein KGL37_04625 [Acidobacteriota bacterium]|nr:hypothetical protein [Acidobacteriota bacterium]
MNPIRWSAQLRGVLWLAALAVSAGLIGAQQAPSIAVAPSKLAKIGTVSPRYLSYSIDMATITGGRPFDPTRLRNEAQGANRPTTPAQSHEQFGASHSAGQYRPPIDLSNPRLRKLAEALSPAYLRISGTSRNSTYFQDDDKSALTQPPPGFGNILTRAEWKGVIDFSRAAGDEIVTSFSISPGTRDANGVWTPKQAEEVFNYTRQIGATIAATEFMNEPSFAEIGGAPKGYDAADFARDAKIFAAFLRKESPKTIFLGPGSVGEGVSLVPPGSKIAFIHTEDMMKATGPIFDAFSYHFYGTVAHRCMGSLTVGKSMSAEWLDRTNIAEAFYAAQRDKYLPGKPLWITETSQAGCGGDEFAGQFVDSFRYLNQLGTLAQKGVKVVVHQTLIGSNYGFVNAQTQQPVPNYWAAVLWKRTMGTTVLGIIGPPRSSTRIYAQCMKGTRGGVTLLALNTSGKDEQPLTIPLAADRYTLTAADLTSPNVLLNGTELQAGSDGSLPVIKGQHVSTGTLQLAPLSITFLTMPTARNKSCM